MLLVTLNLLFITVYFKDNPASLATTQVKYYRMIQEKLFHANVRLLQVSFEW